MKLNLVVFCGAVLAAGCVSVRDYKPRPEASGLYRAVSKDVPYSAEPEMVLRDQDRRLVTDRAAANHGLNGTPSLSALGDNARADTCSVKTLYPAKVEQYRAEDAIRAQEYAVALEALAAAERLCADLYLITPQEYLKALALSRLGRPDEARAAAERFLAFGAAIEPARYTQFNGPTLSAINAYYALDAERVARYRALAKAYLAGDGWLTWDEPARTAKFYENNPFRPGGNRIGQWLVLPAFASNELLGPSIGAVGYFAHGKNSISASIVSTQTSGAFQSVRVRRSVYESPNRDLDVDVFAGGQTVKSLKVEERRVFGYTDQRSHVEKTAFEPIFGAGATYRLRPHYGITGQLGAAIDSLRHRTGTNQSLYGFYDLWPGLSLNAGWINSRPMASVSVLFGHLGYNFRDQRVEVFWQNLLF